MIDLPSVENRFTTHFPADPSSENIPRQVSGAVWSQVQPTPVSSPHLIAYSADLAKELGLSAQVIQSQEFLEMMSGNRLADGAIPYSMNYGGHQFGNWAGQLGDGRAISIGELRGEDGSSWTLQLKGAGPTPYSRTADGRAVLRSSIREFVCSEAMHHLGIATTRALTLVSTGESVLRDMFYDGNPAHEPGAIVCRVSPSFLRFGNFEIHAARRETDLLKQLADWVITEHYPHLGSPSQDTYLAWFQEVCDRTIRSVVDWMRVGFVHGVLNTDNMSVLGLTIDYGPYGWIDHFTPDWTPNTTDAMGRRYVFGNQPKVAHWNLAQFARSLIPLIGDPAPLQEIVNDVPNRYGSLYRDMMASKLGFRRFESPQDEELLKELFELFEAHETDMTNFFRALAYVDPSSPTVAALTDVWYGEPSSVHLSSMDSWLQKWADRIVAEDQSPDERIAAMNRVNPAFIPRNWLVQEAIDQAHEGLYDRIHQLMDLIRSPYDAPDAVEGGIADLAKWKRPEWARHKPGSSMLSCSS